MLSDNREDGKMKKRLFLVLILSMLVALLSGCSEEVKFEAEQKDFSGFHEVNVAEKVGDGIVYCKGTELLYEKNGETLQISDFIEELWREENILYFVEEDVLYNYNLDTKAKEKMVERPYTILGKYGEDIISYTGRSIFTINGTKKTKIFKDGYYVNVAVLYGNKVYGIPARNVYEYNLDTLEVTKVTTDKPDFSRLNMINGELYITTEKEKGNKRIYTMSKVTDEGLSEVVSPKGKNASLCRIVNNGLFFMTNGTDADVVKNSKLLYVQDGKTRTVDKGFSYDVIGVIDNKVLYYKNDYIYGSEGENLTTFYLYDGKDSVEAFDLDVGNYEGFYGYEYDGGLLIEVSHESSTSLYNYDGKNIEEIELPDYTYAISALDIVDNKIYIKYYRGLEDMEVLGCIVDLK